MKTLTGKPGKVREFSCIKLLTTLNIADDSDDSDDESEDKTDGSSGQTTQTGVLEDLIKDRLFHHALESRHVKIMYDKWHIGIITWYNSKLDKYRVVVDDKSEDYISIDDINEADTVLL